MISLLLAAHLAHATPPAAVPPTEPAIPLLGRLEPSGPIAPPGWAGSQCALFLALQAGAVQDVLVDDCPEPFAATIGAGARAITWTDDKLPVEGLSGLLRVVVTGTDEGTTIAADPQWPSVAHRAAPRFPPSERGRGDREVVCRALVTVEKDGASSAVESHGCSAAFGAAVREAVQKWRWEPVVVGGTTLRTLRTVTVHFRES